MSAIAIWGQLNAAVPTTPAEMVISATMATKVVLVVLILLSLTSWAIMLVKWLQFRRVHTMSETFMRDFERSAGFEQAAMVGRRMEGTPHARILSRAHTFIT